MEATCFKTKTDTEDELLESDGKQKTTDQILYKREFKKKNIRHTKLVLLLLLLTVIIE